MKKVLCNIRVQPLPFWSAKPWQKIILAMLEAVHNNLLLHEHFDKSFFGKEAYLELILVDDTSIAKYNQSFLECYGPTNVLSFPDENTSLSGTIFISVDTLQRECILYGQTVDKHAKHLLAHGIAHLMGYDHSPEMDAICQRMENAVNNLNELLK